MNIPWQSHADQVKQKVNSGELSVELTLLALSHIASSPHAKMNLFNKTSVVF